MHPKTWIATGLILAMTIGSGAGASDREEIFDVSTSGLSLGTLQLVANESGSNYAARLVMRGGGLVSALVKFSFDGTGRGRVNGDGMPVSSSYDGTRVLRDDSRRTVMGFKGGRVTKHSLDPAKPDRPFDVTVGALRGVMDPVSAAYALLIDQPAGKACNRVLEVFDGSRQFRISVGPRKANGKGWTCSGSYLRVAGYSPSQMAKRQRYPFTLYYEERDGMMRVTEFRTDSIVGDAVARRRN